MILYIHGFRTTATSYMAKQLKGYFGDKIIISDHSFEPYAAVEELEKIILQNNITGIIASSLGGYYATYLGNKYNIKTVLINPSVEPHITTRQYLGNIDRTDGTSFQWEERHLEELSNLWVESLSADKFYLCLKRGDKVLDYRVAQDRYAGAKMIVEDDGDHRFSDLARHFAELEQFLS